MNIPLIIVCILTSILSIGLGDSTYTHAASRDRGKPQFANVRDSLKNYESAKQAVRVAPRALVTHKQLMTSYLHVVDARLERLEEAVRKVTPSLATNGVYLSELAADRTEITKLLSRVNEATTSQELAAVNSRVRSLRVFTNTHAARMRVLLAHRDVLQAKGVAVLEMRIDQMTYALEILSEKGKDVSRPQSTLERIRTKLEAAQTQISQLTLDGVGDDTVFVARRNELAAIESLIRSTFADLDVLAQQGKIIRDQ